MTNLEPNNYRSSHFPNSLSLTAQSIGLSAADRTNIQGKIGQIHSIFKRVINVTVRDTRLLSVVGQEVGQGPLNIVVNIPSHINLMAIRIKRGDIVTRIGESIIIGEN
jgi:hypothetical protein